MDLSETLGMRSAFYFICGHTDPHDADYKIYHPAKKFAEKIHERGHEIGLTQAMELTETTSSFPRALVCAECASEGIDQENGVVACITFAGSNRPLLKV